MMNRTERKLVLECGEEYRGIGFGADVDRICEIVFNTAMVGYEKVLSDPANADLGVVMTYPLIGNCGIIEEDLESKIPSNFRQTNTLSEVMEECGIPGITGVDTRRLTRSLRDNGTMRGMICSADTPTDEALLEIKRTPVRHDAATRVSTKKKWHMRTAKHKSSVIVIDLGIRLSLVRAFAAGASNVTVTPTRARSARYSVCSCANTAAVAASASSCWRKPNIDRSRRPSKYPCVKPDREKTACSSDSSPSGSGMPSASHRSAVTAAATYSGRFIRPSILAEQTPAAANSSIRCSRLRSFRLRSCSVPPGAAHGRRHVCAHRPRLPLRPPSMAEK